MPVYNGARFLHEALDSILCQTIRDFDYVIINDGSTDGTSDILASYHDPRITVLNQANIGLAGSLNRGLRVAHTDLVARMDADDIALHDRLETQLAQFERLGKPDVLGGNVEWISENGDSVGTRRIPLTHDEIVNRLEQGVSPFAHPTVLYKRESVLRHAGYDEFFRFSAEDFDLWLRMCADSYFANMDKVILKLRISHGSMESRILSKAALLSHSSSAWYQCVAMQRHLLEREHAGYLWRHSETTALILDLLWPRFVESRLADSVLVNRALALAKADMKTCNLRGRALEAVIRLLVSHPLAVTRYTVFRRYPRPRYLTVHDITEELSRKGFSTSLP